MISSDGASARAVQTAGPVLIIGSGLLGASLGLALRAGGVKVYLEDASPTSLRLASDVGAGQAFGDVLAEAGVRSGECGSDTPSYEAPSLVVVATPPDVADRVIVASKQLRATLARTRWLVASVAALALPMPTCSTGARG